MHDVNAISDALLSTDDSSRIKYIRIHCPKWGLQYEYDTKVECDIQKMWSRLADVMRKPQFSRTRLLDVQVPYKLYGEFGVQMVQQCLHESAARRILRLRDLGSRMRPDSNAIRWE